MAKPFDLRCEYLVDPLGIDVERPRLGWKTGQGQAAYRILVAARKELLDQDRGDLWDSGKISSDETVHIEYGGKSLEPGMRCFWKVRVFGDEGRPSEWSDAARWSMGLLAPSDWKGEWIGPGAPASDVLLRRTFDLVTVPEFAAAHVGSLGYHELYVNDARIGDQVLTPCISDLSKRVRYVTYDITSHLRRGANVLTIRLGSGWANFESFGHDDKPLAISQVDIENRDLSSVSIGTNDSWETRPGSSDLLGSWSFGHYGGERIDAGREPPSWEPASVFDPRVALSAEMIEPNRRIQALEPIMIEKRSGGAHRVDMGKSYTGWFEIKLKGEPGSTVTLKFSEREDQVITYDQFSEYLFDNTGEGTFSHRFNYSAGRWITLEGLPNAPDPDDVTGYLVRNDYKRVGRFECSNALLNRIYETVLWTFQNLSLGGYVVDCPHRERWGYGGDCHATMETGLDNFDLGAFYTKWLMDWRDVQSEDGNLPHTAPTYKGGGGPAWSGICITLPWEVYLTYADERILEVMYPAMKRWIAFLDTKSEDDILRPYGHDDWGFLGDWVPPGKGQAKADRVDDHSTLFFNNAYRLYNIRLLARIAEVLEEEDDAKKYCAKAEAVRAAVHDAFHNPEDNVYAGGGQTNLALALLADLPSDDLKSLLLKKLEDEILVETKGHIDTGIHGTYFLVKILTEMDRSDLVFETASKKTYPSWGYMLEQGATTVWEEWDGGNSLLHSSFLSIGAWFIEGIAGIRLDEEHPGYKHFYVKPAVVGDLQWARGEYDSIRGKIVSEWRIEGGELRMKVVVPPNTSATVLVPGEEEAKHEVGPGLHEFRASAR